MSRKQEQIILILEKEIEKEKKERIWVEERQLVFCIHTSAKERLMLGEGKTKRRKTVSKQKGSFFAPLLTALAPTAVDLVRKLIR